MMDGTKLAVLLVAIMTAVPIIFIAAPDSSDEQEPVDDPQSINYETIACGSTVYVDSSETSDLADSIDFICTDEVVVAYVDGIVPGTVAFLTPETILGNTEAVASLFDQGTMIISTGGPSPFPQCLGTFGSMAFSEDYAICGMYRDQESGRTYSFGSSYSDNTLSARVALDWVSFNSGNSSGTEEEGSFISQFTWTLIKGLDGSFGSAVA
jgi:hypothetical protein